MDKTKTVAWIAIAILVLVVITLVYSMTSKSVMKENEDGSYTAKQYPFGIGAKKAVAAANAPANNANAPTV